MPTTVRSRPAPWIALAGFFVRDSVMPRDLDGLSAVTLLRRHEFDPFVVVLVVVPADGRGDPLACLPFGGKWLSGVVRPILHCPEQRFGVRVVVGDPWLSERPEPAQLFEPAFQRGRPHGVAVVGMGNQRLLPARLFRSEASPAHQFRCNSWILNRIHIPGHDLAAPDLDHQVEVQPGPAHGGGDIRDVPTPHLVRS